jgi:hypothetical protein
VLPGKGTVFARAAEAVRAGFLAAHAAAGSSLAIETQETRDRPNAAVDAIADAARRGARLVVGPLTRDDVDAVVRSGGAGVAVLALSFPSTSVPLPPSILAMGVRVEDEARSIVRNLVRRPLAEGADRGSRPFAIVSGAGVLERRIGAAFAAAVREHGHRAETIELAPNKDPKDYRAQMTAVGKRLAQHAWQAILLALNAGDAATLKPWLPKDASVIATSRVHLVDASTVGLVQDLEGIAFVDMPWLLEPDHPAVMVYPRPATPYGAELARLYALGIDAYRVAEELLRGGQRFEIDGVSGWLRVDPALAGRVERSPALAVFRNGKAERMDVLR